MSKIAYVVTHPITASTLLAGQLGDLKKRGHDVLVVSAPGPELDACAAKEGVRSVPIAMEREMSPMRDARALAELIALFNRERPDLVNASTPKAGLLATLAARATRVKHRVYLVRGLRLETERGARRKILTMTERAASHAATHVVCNSPSLERAYRALNLASTSRFASVGVQSSNGIDTSRFDPARVNALSVRRLAKQLGIPSGARVIGFVGRPVHDKGVVELMVALDAPTLADVWCVVVGASFSGDTSDVLVEALRKRTRTVVVPAVEDVVPYYAIMNVLAFPSHREGMPNVVLEAACMQVPAVGFDVTGVRDAIVDGETGTLVAPFDTNAFASALHRYVSDVGLRIAHGRAGRQRAVKELSHARVCEAWAEFYAKLLSS